MAASTDEMYSSSSRYLHMKYVIYFSNTNVLEVDKSNYLISSSILEETYKKSTSPFGDISSNELELTILSQNGLFNPKNTKSPYYGLMKRDVKIEAFIRPNEVDEWDPFGVFYVSDWSTSSGGMTAEITANDKLHSILNAPVQPLRILRDVPFKDFVISYFSLFGVDVVVDDSIQLILPYGFTSGYTDNRRLLADLMIAAIADCFCSHNGSIHIKSKIAERELRSTLTDNDQVISATIKQSLATDYDSVSVTCNSPQESAEQNILSIKDLQITPGINIIAPTEFSSPRVLKVKSVNTYGESVVKPLSFSAYPEYIECSFQSTSDTTTLVEVVGTVLEMVSSKISTDGTKALELNSEFIQTSTDAQAVLEFADNFVKSSMPTLDIRVRGNPKLQLGDKVEVDSQKYNVLYTGTIIKSKYTYDGGLVCEMTLEEV